MDLAQSSLAPKQKRLKSAAFWGICDIKYDPREPKECDRIRVLELGDGRSSRFSHHGRAIKIKFESEYCMDETPIKRAVMVENKKFTHDMFVQEGFAHLRPRTFAYARRYEPDLAQRILCDLKVFEGAVVLKLCNRSRGAGVVVVPARRLDDVLRMLLIPLIGDVFQEWLKERAASALTITFDENLDEQCLHWWSNECPTFIAEECCCSEPVALDMNSDEVYDGTMRVAFALYRPLRTRHQDALQVSPFEIGWLGGYWKLPRVPTRTGGEQSSLEEMHGRIVSSFNSVEKRTAEVPQEHLDIIYAALAPALPRIFASGSLGVQMIMSRYTEDPLFRAFALSRVAAAMRVTDMTKAEGLFDLARKNVPAPTTYDAQDLPLRAVLSYIDRNMAVCAAMRMVWDKAIAGFQRSLFNLPTNSTSFYLEGVMFQEQKKYKESVESMLKSISLDPDFKSPYIALGGCYLLMECFHEAIDVCNSCFRRHPDAAGAQFNNGQAIYHLVSRGRVHKENAEALCVKARNFLDLAKKRTPEQWAEDDETMLQYCTEAFETRSKLPRVPVHVWKVYGWRP